jgi:hypothetical protein
MAYLNQQEEDEQQGVGLNQTLAPQAGQTAPTPVNEPAQGQNSGAATSTQAAAPSQSVNPKAGSGSFTNLRSYLNANQGNRIASAASQKIQNTASGAQKGIARAGSVFGKQVDQGSLANRGTAVQETSAISQAARGVAAQPQTVLTPPQPVAPAGQPGIKDAVAVAAQPLTPIDKDNLANREAPTAPTDLSNPTSPAGGGNVLNTGGEWKLGETSESRESNATTPLESVSTDRQYLTPSTATATAPEAVAAPEVAPASVQEKTPQYLSDEQQQRFAEIINAKYKGPQSLRQSGLYDQTSGKVQEAQKNIDAGKSVQGREQLLRDMFSKGRDYSRGQSNLDSLLLNTSQQGVQQVQDQAKAAGNVQSELEKAQNTSQNLATSRTNEISGIQEQARTAFSGEQTAERDLTEKRIADMTTKPVLDAAGNPVLKTDGSPMTEWDRLPEHFKSAIKNRVATNTTSRDQQVAELNKANAPTIQAYNSAKAELDAATKKLASMPGQNVFGHNSGDSKRKRLDARKDQQKVIDAANRKLSGVSPAYNEYQSKLAPSQGQNLNMLNLSPEEAAILGISAGEGSYNLGEDLIQTEAADNKRLVSRDEVARQQALAQLAGLDNQKRLSTNQEYGMEGAGTQNSMSALNTAGVRRALNEAQENFKNSAEGATITGTGEKKVSRGNMFGKKTSTYNASVSGNAADMLRQAGYDVGAEGTSGARSLLQDKDMLNRYLGATSTSNAMDRNIGGSTLEGSAAGAGTGAGIGTAINPGVGTAIGAGVGAVVGGAIGSNSVDPYQQQIDMMRDFEDKLGIKGAGAVAQGAQDFRNAYGGLFTGAGNMVGGSLGKVIGGIGSAVSGIDTKAMAKMGNSMAEDFAKQDLQRKYAAYLQGQGFENRTNIQDTEATRERTAGLQALLARMDKTNVG